MGRRKTREGPHKMDEFHGPAGTPIRMGPAPPFTVTQDCSLHNPEKGRVDMLGCNHKTAAPLWLISPDQVNKEERSQILKDK